jgi:hypothetical protein
MSSIVIEETPRGQKVLHLMPDSAPTAPAPSFLPDEVGHLSLYFLLIDTTRYNLGRPGAPAQHYAEALAKTLPELPPFVRQQLVQDITLALQRDAVRQAARAGRPVSMISSMLGEVPPTYEPADRLAWLALLQAAAELGAVPNEFREPAGS